MISIATCCSLAMSFPNVEEKPHFEKRSFRVKQRIFATIDEKKNIAVVKLSAVDQSVFCSFDEKIIRPIPGGWGKQGWTIINLAKVKKATLRDALTTAYSTVLLKAMPKKRKS